MSISEFNAALRNRALQTWFKNEAAGGGSASASAREKYALDNINVLTNPVGIYRAGEQTAQKTAFIITRDTVRDLIKEFHGIEDLDELEHQTNIHFSAFRGKGVGAQVSRKKITVGKDLPAVYFPNIGFDTITKLVNNIMNIKSGDLAKYFEKGHVIGLTTELMQATSERIRAVDTTGSSGKSFLLGQLDKVIEYYRRLDLESANIQPAGDVAVYASVNKSISKKGQTRYLVELQPKVQNQKSAKEVAATIGSIRKLFSPGTLSEKAIADLITKLQDTVTDPKFQQDLLDMKSSPSFLDMIGENIAAILSGAKIDQQYTHTNVKVASKKIASPNLQKVRASAKTEIAKAAALKAKLKTKLPPLRTTSGKFYSIANLKAFLDQELTEQIKKNMGRGSRRDVLNLRTGRFAESAKVNSLSQSREGMITAYYTYMKYPYATFSEGGVQQYPKTRDPKLLITKSIKELMSFKVAARMRAVLV